MFNELGADGENLYSIHSVYCGVYAVYFSPSLPHIVVIPGDLFSNTKYILLQLSLCVLFSFIRQLLAPGYQEIWYTPDGARKSSSPSSTVSL